MCVPWIKDSNEDNDLYFLTVWDKFCHDEEFHNIYNFGFLLGEIFSRDPFPNRYIFLVS